MDSGFNIVGAVMVATAVGQILLFHLFLQKRMKNPVQESQIKFASYLGAFMSGGFGVAFLLGYFPIN